MSPEQTPQIIGPQSVVTFTYIILDSTGGVIEQSDLPMSYIYGMDDKTYPKVEDGEMTLDANHPFAGMTVKFKITAAALRHATPQDFGTGEVTDMQGPLTLQ